MTSPFSTVAANLVALLATESPAEVAVDLGPPRSGSGAIDVTLWTAEPGVPEQDQYRRHVPGLLTFVASIDESGLAGLDLLHDLWLAVDASPFDLASEGPAVGWWSAHGVAPRPHLAIHTQVVAERALSPSPMVTEPMVLVNTADTPNRSLQGRVLGPGARPIAGARVVPVNSPALATTTNVDGDFLVRGAFTSDVIDVSFVHRHLSASASVPVDAPGFSVELSSHSSSSSS